MRDETYVRIKMERNRAILFFSGRWQIDFLDRIEAQLHRLEPKLEGVESIVLDLGGIESIDTGSMVFFISARERLKRGRKLFVRHVPAEFCRMFRLVKRFTHPVALPYVRPYEKVLNLIADIGKSSADMLQDFLLFLNFLGQSTVAAFHMTMHPSTFRFKETATNIYKAGTTALPIIALSIFLVGIVIAFQSAVQLQKYGANIFIVEMIGISIPRELAPLITAIIVAGRSGSSYTAQIGVMKITEEIDAMKTMGFEIFRFVVLPRMIAMMIALPLLIFFADIVGIYGGLLVAKVQLDITPAQFLERLHEEVDVRHYLVGLFKGPFFAFIIAAIGCFRGFQVSGNTESIGRYTTISVVNSIFLVIAMDAIFSVIFTELDI
ncbi:ABC transporter permease [Hydrogenimonas cancrithermarum]|uniref:ABC transporter permease n=1 Tax=Hydrogenimonas cancrithermarum TaxID=2993563 RepID=A0ABM8FK99_9BACT|nr:MlaE family lipid ABC transporter permease subunit [Hydrogenimonas cancrithermarum]BDY12093.1 ABC transporter permease [Hydrogenimonas cancrithermarum]